MNVAKNYINDFLHLFFPHVCIGCGSDILNTQDILCAKCIDDLPITGFIAAADNPVEKIFYGRMNIQCAGSAFYFNKNSVMQHAIIQLKYKNNKAAGIFLGKLLGWQIAQSTRFDDVDLIVPVPLNDKKFYKRGYNQAEIIAKGIASIWHKPVVANAIERVLFTETQTHKNRIDRWKTIEGVFNVNEPEAIANKHILLVDDVITTGSTLEACGHAILKILGIKLSIATIAYTI
jgi:ComF family protein